ncbi:hypothetical protein B0H16DRAFT_1719634 [Mycena metata]|uniref:Uncharacterized protein n=1 Tax=Mycena metata TaxID=1033252 RepID=A0AAD7JEQ0_9AGAR|nr:hypothetical protein B0H16DRAFT_1719634 [Mycena metata]
MSLPSVPLSSLEAGLYYRGLPSNPRLVARSGAPWHPATGPETYPRPKELRPIGKHAINDVWEEVLASEDPTSACREVLFKYHITNINVEIRESVVTRSVGPALLEPVHRGDPTYSIRESLTPTLGLSISPALNLDIQGTGGFFIRDERDLSTLFLVTCRHVVLPRNFENDHYASNGIEAEVVLLGNRAYQEFQASVENAVNAHDENLELQVALNRATKISAQRSLMPWDDPTNRVLAHDPRDFLYPDNRLLQLKGTIPETELTSDESIVPFTDNAARSSFTALAGCLCWARPTSATTVNVPQDHPLAYDFHVTAFPSRARIRLEQLCPPLSKSG